MSRPHAAAAPMVGTPTTARIGGLFMPSHCPELEYEQFVDAMGGTLEWRRRLVRFRDRFVQRYPDLGGWFDRPLRERVGWRRGEHQTTRREPADGFDWAAGRINHHARPYLIYLGLTGRLRLDWGWLFGVGILKTWTISDALGLPTTRQIDELLQRSSQLGLAHTDCRQRTHWAIPRMLLHAGHADITALTSADVEELRDVLHNITAIPDIETVLPLDLTRAPRVWSTYAFQTGVVLFHGGIIDTLPVRSRTKPPRPVSTVPAIAAVMQRYLRERALIDRPTSVQQTRAGLLRLSDWLAQTRPTVTSLAQLTREDLLAFVDWLGTQCKLRQPEQPLSPAYRRMVLHQVTSMFRTAAQAGWDDAPARSPLTTTDIPRTVIRVPRFIPAEQLEPLMDAIRELPDPMQRCALLVARWSGARRSEIRKLHLDCLDTYPDGTHRLRLAAGKSRKERVVPIHPEAAAAVTTVAALRQNQPDRAIWDPDLGRPVRYLFLHNGRLASPDYLFVRGLDTVCHQLGLITPDGKILIHPHRFRHTLGTQLGEKGAKVQTIMKVLGHRSAGMSMTYTSLSDPVVLADYQAVLQPGAVLAGPQAEALRNGDLTREAIDWLATNFYKTELELGRCLRLPQEGPCECDLYLTCAKFVTTPAYADRIRARIHTEEQLVTDADARGWPREADRHRRTIRRLHALLDELGEPPTTCDPHLTSSVHDGIRCGSPREENGPNRGPS